MTKQIITAETVRLAWKAGESVIVYAKGDIVTQQAQDDARHYGITLTTETPVAPSSALAEPEAEAVPPVSPVLEEVPASQEPVHVPTPALTADQLAAAARQLQPSAFSNRSVAMGSPVSFYCQRTVYHIFRKLRIAGAFAGGICAEILRPIFCAGGWNHLRPVPAVQLLLSAGREGTGC